MARHYLVTPGGQSRHDLSSEWQAKMAHVSDTFSGVLSNWGFVLRLCLPLSSRRFAHVWRTHPFPWSRRKGALSVIGQAGHRFEEDALASPRSWQQQPLRAPRVSGAPEAGLPCSAELAVPCHECTPLWSSVQRSGPGRVSLGRACWRLTNPRHMSDAGAPPRRWKWGGGGRGPGGSESRIFVRGQPYQKLKTQRIWPTIFLKMGGLSPALSKMGGRVPPVPPPPLWRSPWSDGSVSGSGGARECVADWHLSSGPSSACPAPWYSGLRLARYVY